MSDDLSKYFSKSKKKKGLLEEYAFPTKKGTFDQTKAPFFNYNRI